MKKVLRNNLGISILEVVVAVLIITMGLVGVLSLVIQNIEAQYINKNVLIASGLAQEGLELVRNVRDANWLTPSQTWNQDIINDGTYIIDYGGRSSINGTINSINETGARLYLNGDGFYTHTATVLPTIFYRLVTVVDHTNYLDVSCAIRWRKGTQDHDYIAKTYLYNWR